MKNLGKVVLLLICLIGFMTTTQSIARESTQKANLAVERVKPYVTLQLKDKAKLRANYAVVATHTMKGKTLTIRFNRTGVWLAKNYNPANYKVVEGKKAIKVTWKRNSRKQGKLKVGYGDGKYAYITIKVLKGVG